MTWCNVINRELKSYLLNVKIEQLQVTSRQTGLPVLGILSFEHHRQQWRWAEGLGMRRREARWTVQLCEVLLHWWCIVQQWAELVRCWADWLTCTANTAFIYTSNYDMQDALYALIKKISLTIKLEFYLLKLAFDILWTFVFI